VTALGNDVHTVGGADSIAQFAQHHIDHWV
jgi:hypothetical protein